MADERENEDEQEPPKSPGFPAVPAETLKSLEWLQRDLPKITSPVMADWSKLAPDWQKIVGPLPGEAAIRAAQDMQRVIGAQFEAPRFSRELGLSTDIQAQWAKAFAPGLDRIVNNMTEMYRARIASVLEGLRPTFDLSALKGFAERVRQWEKEQSELLKLIAPRGWLLSPSLAMTAPSEMLRVAREDGLDALEVELIALYNVEHLTEIVEDFYDRPSFEAWRDTFADALDAHSRGTYRLAIPIWLIAIEGIIREEFQLRDVYTVVRKKKGQRVRAAIAIQDTPVDSLLDSLISVLLAVGRDEKQSSTSPVVGRHPILHGAQPDIGGEKDSIQCVLMLEVVHLFVQMADRRQHRAA